MRRAFTLIELLIVVAIIAILAAIAVPNFLEAQVRSKVSRVHNDFRTLATAIGAYTVDYNRPNMGRTECWMTPNSGSYGDWMLSNIVMWRYLTTPTAYISTILKDPFVFRGTKGRDEQGFWAIEAYWYETAAPNPSYRHYDSLSSVDPRGPRYVYRLMWDLSGTAWEVDSPGPSNVVFNWNDKPSPVQMTASAPGDPWSIAYVYDPTNGTKSGGYIIRTNKGIYPN